MRLAHLVPVAGLLLAFALPAAAQESGGFIVRLGADTTSVERYTRTGGRVEVDQVGRAPRVMKRHFTYDYDAKGALQSFSMIVRAGVAAPGAPPTQTITGTTTDDSLFLMIRRPGDSSSVHVAFPHGAVAIASTSPWVSYEHVLMRLAAQKRDTLRSNMYVIGYEAPGWLKLQRIPGDSVSIRNDHDDSFHMRADRTGKLWGALPISGTGKFSAERVASVDVDAYAAVWSSREQNAGAMGALSTRDTTRAEAGGAKLWIDYGRPAKRGRVVYGVVVPFGELWRLGANAATQFKTDRDLDFGGTTIKAGMYTLFAIPGEKSWKLIVNSQTGQWGTERKAELDVAALELPTSKLPAVVERFTVSVAPTATGGVLQLDWDTTRASAAFTVK